MDQHQEMNQSELLPRGSLTGTTHHDATQAQTQTQSSKRTNTNERASALGMHLTDYNR